jgi:hypothetical protein
MNLVRSELGFAKKASRFPKKGKRRSQATALRAVAGG